MLRSLTHCRQSLLPPPARSNRWKNETKVGHQEKSARFGSKFVCRLCAQKLAYNHSTGAMRRNIQLRYLRLPSTHRRCDADQFEKTTQLSTENMLPLRSVEVKGLKQDTEPEYTVTYQPSHIAVTSVIPIQQLPKCYFVDFCELSCFLHVMCTDCS